MAQPLGSRKFAGWARPELGEHRSRCVGVSWGSGALQSTGLQEEAAGSLSPGRGRRISEGTSPQPRRSSLHLDPFNAGSSRNSLPSLRPSGALY